MIPMISQLSCRCGYQWPGDATADESVVCPQCGTVADLRALPTDATQSITPKTDPWATRTAGPSTFISESAVPTIPGYAISDELGRGGMGVVYRAREESLNRSVALKVLLSGAHAGTRDLARFRSEAEAAASVQHPNIVQVYAIGQHAGLPYIALEFVPGGSLAARLAEGALQEKEAARIVQAIARGVQAAHDRGVIHRDLKPANVLFGSNDEPKIADFGLAKVGDSGLTASGAIMGTPAYMAPEQARGDTKAAGPAADIWALGAILYECVTGRQPFRGQSAPETLRKVCESDPDSIQGVPANLVNIALKCLEKDPARRYLSANDVADDLGRFLAGEAVLAKPRGFYSRSLRWAGRHQGPVCLGVGALIAIAIILAFLPPKKTEQEPTPVVEKGKPAEKIDEDDRRPIKEAVVGKMQKASWRMTSTNNLKQLAITAHNISQVGVGLPPPAIYDRTTGKPLLSWRVAYLPFLHDENIKLHKEFKLNEPWDSPHNLALVERMPKIYEIPGTSPPKGQTYYQVLTGPGTLFDSTTLKPGGIHGKTAIRLEQIADGTSNTLLMVEAAKPVIWTKPEDVEIAPDRPLPGFGGHFEGGFNVAMADGSVTFVSSAVSEKTLRAAMSPLGSEVLGGDWPDGPNRKKSLGKLPSK